MTNTGVVHGDDFTEKKSLRKGIGGSSTPGDTKIRTPRGTVRIRVIIKFINKRVNKQIIVSGEGSTVDMSPPNHRPTK